MKGFLSELKLLQERAIEPSLRQQVSISIANNPVQHDGTKHVKVDQFFSKEWFDEGTSKLSYVTSG